MKENNKVILKKENGVVTRVSSADEVRITDVPIRKVHLCWQCGCASPLGCEKVADIIKGSIDKYPFISNGYQVFDEDGRLDEMVVTGCDNFVPERSVYLSKFERAKIQQAKDNLSMLYFGVNSVEEARRLKKEKREIYDEEKRQENLAKRRTRRK